MGLIFCDGHPAGGNYRDLLFVSRAMKSKARIVVALKDAGWDQYLEAMRLGAFDVIASPYRPTDVEWMVIQAKRDERIRLRRAPGVEFGHSNAGPNSAVQAYTNDASFLSGSNVLRVLCNRIVRTTTPDGCTKVNMYFAFSSGAASYRP